MLLLGSALAFGGTAGNGLGVLIPEGGVIGTFLASTTGVSGVACRAFAGLGMFDLGGGDAGLGDAFGTTTGSAGLIGACGGIGGGGAAAFGSSAGGTLEVG